MITVHGPKLSWRQLRKIELVRPEAAGGVWQGIRHADLIKAVQAVAKQRDWKIDNWQASVSKDEADMVAAFELDKLPDLDSPAGARFALAIATSNARRHKLRLWCGARVAICSNGLATGELLMERKHAKGLDLSGELAHAFEDFEVQAARLGLVMQQLKERHLIKAEAEHLILEAGRRGLMPWSRLKAIDREYGGLNPTMPRDWERGTSWHLLQAFTWVVKRNPPLKQVEQMDGFRKLLPV